MNRVKANPPAGICEVPHNETLPASHCPSSSQAPTSSLLSASLCPPGSALCQVTVVGMFSGLTWLLPLLTWISAHMSPTQRDPACDTLNLPIPVQTIT